MKELYFYCSLGQIYIFSISLLQKFIFMFKKKDMSNLNYKVQIDLFLILSDI